MDKKKKPTPQDKSNAGRKGKYETNVKPYLHLIPSWRRDGMTEAEICKKLDVSHESLNKYKKLHLEFFEAIKKGKEEIYAKVQSSFFKACQGYFVEEVITETIDSPLGKTEKVRVHKKWIPPIPANQIFALKNLGEWRDNPDEGKKEKKVKVIDDLPEDEE